MLNIQDDLSLIICGKIEVLNNNQILMIPLAYIGVSQLVIHGRDPLCDVTSDVKFDI